MTASTKQQLTEETAQALIEAWYAQARACESSEQARAFADHLINDYIHDYGTIVHAAAAGAIAMAYAVSQGELTGFQAGCLFWSFGRQWLQWQDAPRRLVDYSKLLLPQYDQEFNTISRSTANWLIDEAAKRISNTGASTRTHPSVYQRWVEISQGRLPSFITIEG